MCENEVAKGQRTVITYQELFNKTLSKMRYATSGALIDNEPLMKALVKIMYDFSDSLKENNLLSERTNDNAIQTNYKNNHR